MAAPVPILLSDLMLDTQNPRLEIQNSPQEAVVALAVAMGEKLVNLAKDIMVRGLNPTELPIVMPTEEDPYQYIVLEGNRRIAALKIMANPDRITGMISPAIERRYRELAKQYEQSPVDSIFCHVVEDREEAEHWIQLRHNGELGGAGIVSWGALERERFSARLGQKTPQLQVFEFVKERAMLSDEARRRINTVGITNIKRLVDDVDVRALLGIDVRRGQVMTRYPDQELLKGLTKIVEDLALKRINVTTIDNKKLRLAYLDTFTDPELPDSFRALAEWYVLGTVPSATDGSGTASAENSANGAGTKSDAGGTSTNGGGKGNGETTTTRKRSQRSSRARDTLIPRSCVLRIPQTRINDIYLELRRLNVDQFPNAVAVMFRVFLELSIDVYIDTHALMGKEQAENSKLREKLQSVANHFKGQNIMDEQQLTPVRRAASGRDYLASSITSLHAYVHNPYFSPTPHDLKTGWDDLQFFIQKLWD